MTMTAIMLIALGGMFAFEGAGWAIFPSQMRKIYMDMFALGERTLHFSGLFSVALGVVFLVAGIKMIGT